MIKFLLSNNNINRVLLRRYILGIETSCDDTGTAIIDLKGNIVSECLDSQIKISSSVGGIIPKVASELHKVNVNPCVINVMNAAGISFSDLSAIAVTVRPGLGFSLGVGRDYAVAMALKYNLPIIPIHHMEAHALTVRMLDPSVEFPFLVLLVSGGNSIIAVAHSVEEFSLLGTKLDMSPGDCLDKIARHLHLVGNGGSHTSISGGRAIELFAMQNKKELLEFPGFRLQQRDCDFSFSGLETFVKQYLYKMSLSDMAIDIPQICASVLHNMSYQICRRIQRSILYCRNYVDPAPNTLVVSGGVGSNLYIRACLEEVCGEYEYRVICPPPKYCTDNGVMIAWNGYELFRLNRRIVTDVESIDYKSRAPLGLDRRSDLRQKDIRLPRLKINKLTGGQCQ